MLRCIGVIFLCGFWATAWAEVPRQNVQYIAGSVLEYPQFGLSYVLPEHTLGVVSPERPSSELIVGLTDYFAQENNGLFVRMQRQSVDLEAVAEELSAAVPFMGTTLQAMGKARVDSAGVYNDFRYWEEGRSFRAFILVMSLSNNSSVMFVAAAPDHLIAEYKTTMVTLAKSIKTSVPHVAQERGVGERPYINQSQNGSVVSGGGCTYASAGGMTIKTCD